MSSYSQVSQSKRGRDECWNGGLALPEAKRSSSGTLAYDSDLMSLLDKIDDIDNYIEFTNENGCTDQIASIKEGELTEWYSETTSSMCDLGDFENYDDVGAEFGFLADHVSHDEFGIIVNYIDGDPIANTMFYSDAAVYGYAETMEDFNGFLWDYDIWQLNEHPVIQNDFA